MAWHWPQWVMAILYGMVLFGSATLHDKPRTGTHNAVTSWILYGSIIYVLHAGGFW